MNLPETRFSRLVDGALTQLAKGTSYLWLVLMAIIVLNVFARYLLDEGRIEFEEIQWHLYSTGFMLVLGFGLISDTHIRVDVLHERFSERVQVWIDLYGLLLFVLPFCLLMLSYSVPFVVHSFVTSEVSASPGGLPYRWIIKSMLFVGFGLLTLAALSRLSRLFAYLKTHAG